MSNKLYDVITQLQATQGDNAKQAILDANKDFTLLRDYLKAVYDPAISYYQTQVPEHDIPSGGITFGEVDIDLAFNYLASRQITGHAAISWVKALLGQYATTADQDLFRWMIARSIGASVGETMILKTWPELWFTVPYQRCGKLDAKSKAKFAKKKQFFIQSKLDGSFVYLHNDEDEKSLITRSGNKYPQWFVERIMVGTQINYVMAGELLVYLKGKNVPLKRAEGNGLLNKILKGAEESDFVKYDFKAQVWTMLTLQEFNAGRSKRPEKERYAQAKLYQTDNIGVADCWTVTSLEEAYKIYSKHTARGEEGCIMKDMDAEWKDGTSSEHIKLKVTFPMELEVIGYEEEITKSSGKPAGRLGKFIMASSDRKLVSGVGTGLKKKDKEDFWKKREAMIGTIHTCEANDITEPDKDGVSSLFLPVWVEQRFDKTAADTYNDCLEQLEAAKAGKEILKNGK